MNEIEHDSVTQMEVAQMPVGGNARCVAMTIIDPSKNPGGPDVTVNDGLSDAMASVAAMSEDADLPTFTGGLPVTFTDAPAPEVATDADPLEVRPTGNPILERLAEAVGISPDALTCSNVEPTVIVPSRKGKKGVKP